MKQDKKWSEMYEKGYQNAIRFAYIPDFKNQDDILEYARGYKDGKGGLRDGQKT